MINKDHQYERVHGTLTVLILIGFIRIVCDLHGSCFSICMYVRVCVGGGAHTCICLLVCVGGWRGVCVCSGKPCHKMEY